MASLEEQLAARRAEFARTAPADRQKLYDRKIEDLRRTFSEERVPRVGDPLPEFELPGVVGTVVSSAEALVGGPIVVTFYRGSWCPYCNIQLQAYQAAMPGIAERGGKLIAISPQLPDESLTTKERNELSFDVLSDVGNVVAKRYGLVFTVPEELREVHRQLGKELPKINGDETWELPVPATFVAGRDGRVLLSHVDVDYRRRLEPAAILAALDI